MRSASTYNLKARELALSGKRESEKQSNSARVFERKDSGVQPRTSMGNKDRQPPVSSETKFNRLSEDVWGKGGGLAPEL